ncbi:MAG: LptF/LptG family permease [Treponema sp.]|nr:LptF/LptG family permease [Treponema sp.]
MILDRYLLRQYTTIFLAVLGFFAFLLVLIDLFAHLVRYLNNEVPFAEILRISMFYLPQAFAFSLPISLLFASAYTLGDLYARNELTSIFSSGIPFRRFSLPLVILGLGAAFFSFFFTDLVVVPTMRTKNELTRRALRQHVVEHNSDIVIRARGGQLIYAIDFYDHIGQVLNGIQIVEKNAQGDFVSLIRAPRATWTGDYWNFVNPVIYFWDDGFLRAAPMPHTDEFREQPDTFRRSAVRPDDLSVWELRRLVEDLKAAGLPYEDAEADFFHRFSFSTVSFIVMVLSLSMGGRFRKNVLLMSLLLSLFSAVVFYVIEMITMMMARLGYIPTVVGAWFPVAVFIAIGLLLLGGAKT